MALMNVMMGIPIMVMVVAQPVLLRLTTAVLENRASVWNVRIAHAGTHEEEVLEECDDGNTTNGDGCSDECLVESTYHCSEWDLNGSNNSSGRTVCSTGLTNSCGDFYLETDGSEACEPIDTTDSFFGELSVQACQNCVVDSSYKCFAATGVSLSFCFETGSFVTSCDWDDYSISGG